MSDFYKNNPWVPKIVSLVAASLLWLFVMEEQNPLLENSYVVPLEKRNVAQDIIVFNSPETVRVKVRGVRNAINTTKETDIKAYIDLAEIQDGRHSPNVKVSVPNNLEVVETNPSTVVISTDRIIEKKLPVGLKFVGTATNGVAVGKSIVTPEEVRVVGPSTNIALAFKVIGLVDISGRDSNFEEDVRLVVHSPDGVEIDNVNIQPAKARVSVNLFKQLARGYLPVKANTIGGLPSGLALKKITIIPDKVEVTATPEVVGRLETINTEDILLYDIKENITLERNLIVPPGTTLNVPKVHINIEVERVKEAEQTQIK